MWSSLPAFIERSGGEFELDCQAAIAHRWNAEFLGSAWQPSLRANLTWWPGRS